MVFRWGRDGSRGCPGKESFALGTPEVTTAMVVMGDLDMEELEQVSPQSDCKGKKTQN